MMTRALLKTGISASLAWSGAATVAGHVSGKRRLPLILGYHRVVEDFDYSSRYAIPSSLVSIKTLVRQLDWIARRYEICSLDEVHERANTRRGKPAAAITFDDGYADVYHNAFPLLLKKGLPFSIFVTTDLVGGQDLFAHDELYLRLGALLSKYEESAERVGETLRCAACWEKISGVFASAVSEPYRLTRAMLGILRQKEIRAVISILRNHTELPASVVRQSRVMDWDMVREMQNAGVLIGCHSKTHAIFTKEGETTLLEEARVGRSSLENRLGVPVEHFAYPDGGFNDTAVSAVARAGYRYAYSVCFHRSSRAPQLTVPRRMLWERSNFNVLGRFSGTIMACQVNGVFDARAACASGHR